MRDLVVTSSSIKSYPQGVDKVAPIKENEMNTNTNAPIILTESNKSDDSNRHLAIADTMNKKPEVFGREGRVMSVTTGQYFEETVSTNFQDLRGGLYSLSISRYFFDNETGLEAEGMDILQRNESVFLTRDHARKFALAILTELENDN